MLGTQVMVLYQSGLLSDVNAKPGFKWHTKHSNGIKNLIITYTIFPIFGNQYSVPH